MYSRYVRNSIYLNLSQSLHCSTLRKVMYTYTTHSRDTHAHTHRHQHYVANMSYLMHGVLLFWRLVRIEHTKTRRKGIRLRLSRPQHTTHALASTHTHTRDQARWVVPCPVQVGLDAGHYLRPAIGGDCRSTTQISIFVQRLAKCEWQTRTFTYIHYAHKR